MAKVNIIGAGLAGLSAGIYLQQSGIQTEIFEIAGWAGGVCTAWVRGGYRFDGCIHWMVGTKPGTQICELYREVGALEADTAVYNADSIQIEMQGEMLKIPMDVEGFSVFLHSLSPQDGASIDVLCEDIEAMAKCDMPLDAPSSIGELIKFIKSGRGFISVTKKYLGKTVSEFCEAFQSPRVRALLCMLMPEEFSAMGLVMMLGTRMGGNAGYPMGGALDMIRRMEAKYRALGGSIRFHSRVEEIVVEGGKSTGVRSGGEFYPSDAVIAACDAYDTLKNMLGGKYAHLQIDALLSSSPLFPPLALVSFGLKRKLDIPFSIIYECPEGIETAPGEVSYSLNMRSFDFDPAAAPQGCSVMAMLGAPLDYWQKLRSEDAGEYKKQKQRLADAVADAADKRIPGFKDAIAVTDVATPATYVRLANLYKASFEGFAPTPAALKTQISKRVPGVKKLLLCGQWTTAGGGICSAVASGKAAAKNIQKELKR